MEESRVRRYEVIGTTRFRDEDFPLYLCNKHGQCFCFELGEYCTDCYEEDTVFDLRERHKREEE